MKILHISDTHGFHEEFRNMPDADVIVHSGDFTFAGSSCECSEFVSWFCSLPYRHKVFIAGNHDACMYGAVGISGLPDNVHYLCGTGIAIDGLKFYGVPMFMEECMDGSYDERIRNIPDDTDILVTHQPPKGMCDLADYGRGPEHRGYAPLAEKIAGMRLKCHLFGHEHDAYACGTIGGTIYSNAAVLDDKYRIDAEPRLITI